MQAKHKTPLVTSWRKARALCPQIFGHVHFSTYRRWKDRPRTNYSSGRRKRLSPLQESSLSALAFSLSKQDVPYTLEMFVTLARKKLSLKVSRSWCYRFLKGLRLRWKSMKQGGAAKTFSESETQHLQYMLSAKMWWLAHQKGVAPDRLFNMDETSLSLLPLAAKGWKPAGQEKHKDEADESVTVPNDKAAITCSLVLGFGEGSLAFAQLIYTGKTAASHPVAPSPAHILVDHTDTHWQSAETLLRLLGWLEQQIGSAEPWGLLLDVAPVRVAEAFVSAAKEQFPQCQLIFVRAGTTSICQPCDVSYVRAFKPMVRRSFAECFAEQVLEGSSELGELFKKPNLKGMIPHLVAAAVREINTEEHRQQAWKHLVPEDMPTLLQEAQLLQDYGALFEGGGEKEAEEEEEEDPWQEDDGAEAPEPESGEEEDPEDIQEEAPEAAPAEAAAEAVLSKSAARLLALRVVYGSKPATEPEARALSAHLRWPRGRAPGLHQTNSFNLWEAFGYSLREFLRPLLAPSPCKAHHQKAADVCKKDVWEFQVFSQTFFELRFSLGNEGKDGKNLNSQTWPGTPRRPSSRHPRPSYTICFVVFFKERKKTLKTQSNPKKGVVGVWRGSGAYQEVSHQVLQRHLPAQGACKRLLSWNEGASSVRGWPAISLVSGSCHGMRGPAA